MRDTDIHVAPTRRKSRDDAATRQATGDKFTRDQFEWLRQVAYDSNLQHAASSVAIALTKYFNRKRDGWAWMSQPTLATDLGVSESTVWRALSALVERGHLISKQRGNEETNLYRLTLKHDLSDQSELTDHDQSELTDHTAVVTSQFCTSDQSILPRVTSQNCMPNPLIEPSEEHSETRGAPKARPRSISIEESLTPESESLQSGVALEAPPPLGDPNLTASDLITASHIETEDSVYSEYGPAAPIELSPEDFGPVPKWHEELSRHDRGVEDGETDADDDADEVTDPFSDGDDDFRDVPRGVRVPSEIPDSEIPFDVTMPIAPRPRISARQTEPWDYEALPFG
jgi:biotin operon repressor